MIINGYTYSTPIRPNFKSSLLDVMMKKSDLQSVSTKLVMNPAYVPVSTPVATAYNKGSLLIDLLNKVNVKTTNIESVQPNQSEKIHKPYKNNLRSMFQHNQSVIYALIPRTFNAKDLDGNELIEGNEEPGYFTNMVDRLDELKTYGVNTLHLLPINPTGKLFAKGNAGSVYAPLDFLSIDPNLDDPKNPKNVFEEAKEAIKECHDRDIKVMLDLPSCISVDLYESRPDLSARDVFNHPKTPEGWEDIRMFEVWQDADKRILSPQLIEYHKKFIDMCIDLGIDGIRADVGRAKPPEFWDVIISYARSKDPEFAFLAECYTYEDASPMKNMPADRPEESLAAGFDSYYGQYHIYHMWKAKDFHKFIKENIDMTKRLEKGKSLIGSFATHDDDSSMANGGADFCMMTNVLQATLPMTNPYIISGYESGDRYLYKYAGKYVDKTFKQLLDDPLYKKTIDDLLRFELYEDKDKLKALLASKDINKKIAEIADMDKYKSIIEFLEKNSTTKDNIKYYVHQQRLDIFNNSRKPGGENPEIGQHFGYLMNCVRPKYGELITKGSYIELKVDNNDRDEVIAYARHKDGKTLVTIVNHDVNARQKVRVHVPGMAATQKLEDLSPLYGQESHWNAKDNAIEIDLGPAQAHIFEVDTPNIEKLVGEEKVLKQNL